MLSPKRTKFRKAHKGRIHGNAKSATLLNFGSFGLKATTPGRITARQIEASRRAITRPHETSGSCLDSGVPGCASVTKNLRKFVRVKVRVPRNIGHAVSNLVGLCLKLMASQSRSLGLR